MDFSEKVNADSEERLIRGARKGHVPSFSALVEAQQEKMIHVAYSFLGNWEDARDAAQEAFVKAFQGLRSFNEKSRFSTWLYRIVVNQCKDELRKKKVRAAVPSFSESEEGNRVDVLESEASATDVRQELSNRELEAEIHRSLEGLPFQQRSVFVLRYFEGFKLEEIAESLKVSTGAVKAHLWQAHQKMRQILSRHLSAEERASS